MRVFDGAAVRKGTDVLVTGAGIAAVDRAIPAPEGATVVDGTGRTLLPGL
ncbi:MAG: amidohydrolase family protein, partial [Solirubrobacterales bacterium]|nr:amidohydrolase family protein [Solirubrobacterales bacterium]